MTEQFNNFGAYQLSLPCLAGDTTLHFASLGNLATTGTYRMIGGILVNGTFVGSEIVEVTAADPVSSTLTVVRGTEGTTAIPLPAGATFVPILSAAAFAQLKYDLSGLGVWATFTAGTHSVVPGQVEVAICDTSDGSVVLNISTPLILGQKLRVIHANGSLETNTITVNGSGSQALKQPAPNNASAAVTSVVIGGASQGGAANDGTSITWINLGIANVLNAT